MKKKDPHAKKRITAPHVSPRNKKNRTRVELLGGATIVLFVAIIGGTFFAPGLQQYALRSPEVAAVVASELVGLANQDRAQNDVTGLQVSPLLVEAAQAKANDMASKGYFAHTSPQGIDPWFWFQQVGYNFTYAGENLAVNFSDSDSVNTAWMNSPEHRANLLDPHYTQIGIATAQGMYQGQMTTFVVEEFGTPAPANAPQQPVVAQSVPSTPTQTATASTQSPQVLGAADNVPQQSLPTQDYAVATTAPALAASLSQQTTAHPPLWGSFVAFPRDTLLYLYYALGALILIGLVIDTGFEFHRRHRARAMKAGALFAVLCVCFVLADVFFFTSPILVSPSQSQGASVIETLNQN